MRDRVTAELDIWAVVVDKQSAKLCFSVNIPLFCRQHTIALVVIVRKA